MKKTIKHFCVGLAVVLGLLASIAALVGLCAGAVYLLGLGLVNLRGAGDVWGDGVVGFALLVAGIVVAAGLVEFGKEALEMWNP